VLIAVSGGADSVALLLALNRVAAEFGLSVHAAHLHHGLRGRAADADLAFVRDRCARLGVPLIAARWDTRARMARRGLSGQAGLRALRREFLIAAARRAGATAIATAHHADDQLETVLMRLARGAGLTGLAGMRPRAGRWIKPLLEASRADIEADLLAAGEPWREDGSNHSRAYLRNRVRHDAVPALLAALRPGAARTKAARAALARSVQRAAAEAHGAAELIGRLTRRVLSRHCRIQHGEIALDSAAVASYPFAARRMLLRQLWRRAARGPEGLTHRHLDSLSRLIDGARVGARVELPGGWTARRERGGVRFTGPPRSAGTGASRHTSRGELIGSSRSPTHPRGARETP
jgi:tRNA(Ile)-lysidine synthase